MESRTTLLHALTGKGKPSSGQVMLNGHDINRASDTERVQRGLARSFQVTSLLPDLDVRANLRLAAQDTRRGRDWPCCAGPIATGPSWLRMKCWVGCR